MSEIKDLLSLAAKTTAAYNLNGQMVYVDNDGNHRIIQETNVSPARKPTHVLLTQVGGFMEYVRAHSGKVGGVGDCFGAPRVFASIEPEKCELELVAYLDFFQVDPDDVLAPAQRDYSATFRPRLSEPFRAWVGYDGRNMPQGRFADFISQNQPFIAEPSGADLLEIITNLKASSRGQYRNMTDLHNGSVEVVFDRQVSAMSSVQKQTVEVPTEFIVHLTPFVGEEEMTRLELVADLFFTPPRDDSERLTMGYRFRQKEAAIVEFLRNRIAFVANELEGIPVYEGCLVGSDLGPGGFCGGENAR